MENVEKWLKKVSWYHLVLLMAVIVSSVIVYEVGGNYNRVHRDIDTKWYGYLFGAVMEGLLFTFSVIRYDNDEKVTVYAFNPMTWPLKNVLIKFWLIIIIVSCTYNMSLNYISPLLKEFNSISTNEKILSLQENMLKRNIEHHSDLKSQKRNQLVNKIKTIERENKLVEQMVATIKKGDSTSKVNVVTDVISLISIKPFLPFINAILFNFISHCYRNEKRKKLLNDTDNRSERNGEKSNLVSDQRQIDESQSNKVVSLSELKHELNTKETVDLMEKYGTSKQDTYAMKRTINAICNTNGMFQEDGPIIEAKTTNGER